MTTHLYSYWLEKFVTHTMDGEPNMRRAIHVAISSHRSGLNVVVPFPDQLARRHQMTLRAFTGGLEQGVKKGWLGQMQWAFDDQAILLTLTIPEGLSAD